LKILFVLGFVLNLFFDALEDSNSGGKIVYSPGGSQGGFNDFWGGYEIVCEAVIEASLEFENVLDAVEKRGITVGELFKCFFGVGGRETCLEDRWRNADGLNSLDTGRPLN
jgi:hypothetical protein